MTIESYRQWAREDAEREYACPPRFEQDPEYWDAFTEEYRHGYEAALLRMWPLVEAMQEAQDDTVELRETLDKVGLAYANERRRRVTRMKDYIEQAISSLNLPKP